MKRTVAAITIGQSPRADMTEEIFVRFPSDLAVVEYGVLDAYSFEEAQSRFAPEPHENVLVSRMRDGSQIRLAEEKIIAPLQACIEKAEDDGAAAVLLLCTGEFPSFRHRVPLIAPMPLLHSTAKILADGKKIAIMVPDLDQAESAAERWRESGLEAQIVCASPYLDIGEIDRAAAPLRDSGASFLVMDCIGYTAQMKKLAGQASGLPVLLPRTLMAAVTAQFLSFEV